MIRICSCVLILTLMMLTIACAETENDTSISVPGETELSMLRSDAITERSGKQPTQTPGISIITTNGGAQAEESEEVIMLSDIPTPGAQAGDNPELSPDGYLISSNPESTVPDNKITLSFVGDCSLGDTLSSRKNKSSLTSCIRANGDDWLFETVSDIFHSDDYTFANLEVVLTDQAEPLYPLKSFNLIGRPEFARVLKAGGVDGVNTVNNHSIDFKYKGYEDTLASLDEAGVMHFGSLNPTRTKNSYVTLGRLEIKGIRIGLIGFTYPTNANQELIARDIQTLRSEGCQIVIVSLHWGREERKTPNASQFPFAVQILEAGADMVWGHHTHVLQPVYFYHGKPIFFSTGNFVFGSIKSLDPASGIFQLTWDIHEDGSVALNQFQMIPTKIRHSKQEYRPLVLKKAADQKDCWQHVMGKSDRYDCTKLPDGFEKTGIVYIQPDGTISINP